MGIKKKVLEKIRQSNRMLGLLIIENDVHPNTILRWVKDNDEMLTMAKNLNLISTELNLKQSEILEDELDMNRLEVERLATGQRD